jgi:hypothetical protein
MRPAKKPQLEDSASAGGGGGGGGGGGSGGGASVDDDCEMEDADDSCDMTADDAAIAEAMAGSDDDQFVADMTDAFSNWHVDSKTGGGSSASASASATAAAAAAEDDSRARARAFYAGGPANSDDIIRANKARVERRRATEAKAEAARAERAADTKDTIWKEKGDIVEWPVPPCPTPSESPTADYKDADLFDSAGAFFDLFFDRKVFTDIRNATNANRRARALEAGREPPADLDLKTIRALFGTLLLMATQPAHRLDDYWDEKYGWPAVSSVWTRDSFRDVYQSLRLRTDANPDPAARANCFFEVDPLVDYLNGRFAAALSPGSVLTIDETMIAFRGKHMAIQMMPKKPIRIGFKAWTIATPDGYVFRSQLYHGSDEREHGLGARVVLDLIDGFDRAPTAEQKPWRLVVMDSYYTGVPLAKTLFDRGMLMVGKLNPTFRHFPAALAETKLEPSAFDWRQAKLFPALIAGLFVPLTRPKDYQRFISTGVDVPVQLKDVSGKSEPIPSFAAVYNRQMCGVDIANQYAARYTPWRRSKRHWMSVCLHMLHVALANAYLLMRWYGSLKPMSFFDFHRAVAEHLLQGFPRAAGRMGRPPKNPRAACALVQTTKLHANGKRIAERCSICCYREGSRDEQQQTGSQTTWRCIVCEVPVCAEKAGADGKVKKCWQRHLLAGRAEQSDSD